MDRWLAVSTVARVLERSSRAIRKGIYTGRIAAIQTKTGHWWISASELARLREKVGTSRQKHGTPL